MISQKGESMSKSNHTEAQMIGALKQLESQGVDLTNEYFIGQLWPLAGHCGWNRTI